MSPKQKKADCQNSCQNSTLNHTTCPKIKPVEPVTALLHTNV